MYEKLLTSAGLSPKEADIYEILLSQGQAAASEINKKTPYKRGLVYKILDQLAEKGLILKIERPRKVTLFRVEHPYKINEMLENQAKRVETSRKTMDELMPQLVSNFNLAFNKPGVRFFEGKAGIKQVLDDTLTAKDVIYTYADIQAVIKYTEDINKEYIKRRNKLQINKKVITIDSPYSRNFFKSYYTQITDTRFIDHQKYPFSSVMQIYDNRVAYISLSEESLVAVLISDKNIFQMQKSLFEYNWRHAKAYTNLPPLSSAQ